MTTVLIFFLVLGALVLVHELGHFLTARFFGVKAEEFGLGLPPRLGGFKKINGKWKWFWGSKESEQVKSEATIISLNWLPLGGFVKIKGEDGVNREPDSFLSQKAWKRALIVSAGVIMNFIFGAVMFALVFMLGSNQIVDSGDATVDSSQVRLQIMQVIEGSPASVAGLKIGDVIESLDGQTFSEVNKAVEYIGSHPSAIKLSVSRLGEKFDQEITPRRESEASQYRIGVALVETGMMRYPWYLSIWYGFKSAGLMAWLILSTFVQILARLITGQAPGVEVSGPVGIAVMTGQVARMGITYLLQFAGMLSINLMVINFLPLPALDGGRFIFILIEKIRRKPVNQKIESIVHSIGFLLLMALILVITGVDIFKFFRN